MKQAFSWIPAIMLCFIVSCGERAGHEETGGRSETTMRDSSTALPSGITAGKEFKTKGSLVYVVREDKSLGASVSRITVLAKDSSRIDSLNLGEKDPVQEGLLADLDRNGKEELYIITRNAGSGSYAHVFGFTQDSTGKLAALEIPEPAPEDQAVGRSFNGYLGHDSIYIRDHQLIRSFPVYKPGDPNSKPSGGSRAIHYALNGRKLEQVQ